jgi:hypothetical protein
MSALAFAQVTVPALVPTCGRWARQERPVEADNSIIG